MQWQPNKLFPQKVTEFDGYTLCLFILNTKQKQANKNTNQKPGMTFWIWNKGCRWLWLGWKRLRLGGGFQATGSTTAQDFKIGSSSARLHLNRLQPGKAALRTQSCLGCRKPKCICTGLFLFFFLALSRCSVQDRNTPAQNCLPSLKADKPMSQTSVEYFCQWPRNAVSFISVSSSNNLVQVQGIANTKAENHLLCLQCVQLSFSSKRILLC